jgi:hypothetical protein
LPDQDRIPGELGGEALGRAVTNGKGNQHGAVLLGAADAIRPYHRPVDTVTIAAESAAGSGNTDDDRSVVGGVGRGQCR